MRAIKKNWMRWSNFTKETDSYHGNCKECVAIHRAHQEHVPNCMRPVINAKKTASEAIMKKECLICGAPLEYLEKDELMKCAV